MISVLLTTVFFAQTPSTPATADEKPKPVDPAYIEAPPPDMTAARVAEAFVLHVQAHEVWPESAKRFVAGQAEKLADDQVNLIHGCLAVVSPEFKKGLDQLFDDKYADAAKTLSALARDEDPFLAVAAAGLATAAFVELEQIQQCHEMLDHVIKTHRPVDRFTPAPENLRFMIGYCLVHTLQYEHARATLEAFLKHYPNAPERLRVAATQMLTELARRAPGRLGDVRDLMAVARRRISHGDTGDRVKDHQKKAVELLDALIEEAEEQEQNGDGGGGGGGGGGGAPGGSGQPQGGANQSRLPGGGANEENLRRKRARPGESWGRMPPKQRDEFLQNLQKQFPSRYRDLLEQYYEQLAREPNRP